MLYIYLSISNVLSCCFLRYFFCVCYNYSIPCSHVLFRNTCCYYFTHLSPAITKYTFLETDSNLCGWFEFRSNRLQRMQHEGVTPQVITCKLLKIHFRLCNRKCVNIVIECLSQLQNTDLMCLPLICNHIRH